MARDDRARGIIPRWTPSGFGGGRSDESLPVTARDRSPDRGARRKEIRYRDFQQPRDRACRDLRLLSAGPSFLRRAATLLHHEGPAHTLDLARRVLGLTGNDGAASAAVFALLGSDPRFAVDGTGCWSLVGEVPEPGLELGHLAYAVVDVETTGGAYGRGHRITEIAIVEIEGGAIVRDFHTLVNPGRTIPPRIVELTGISNEMVAGKPFFEDVAPELMPRLEGRVFVAHNMSFDWGFVSAQLADALGEVPGGHRLCTVQMARRLAPELRRRNLDAVASHFGIPIHARHRAHGDALATARVLLRLLDEAQNLGITDLPSLQRLLSRRPAPGRAGASRGA